MFLYIEDLVLEWCLISPTKSWQEVRIMQDKALSRRIIGREVVAHGRQPHTRQVIINENGDV